MRGSRNLLGMLLASGVFALPAALAQRPGSLKLEGHEGVLALALSPDGNTLVTASLGEVKVWDARTGSLLSSLKGPTEEDGVGWSAGMPLAFSPDGRTLATRGALKTGLLWDTDTWKPRSVLPIQEGNVEAMAFSRDGSRMATIGSDGPRKSVTVWDTTSGQERRTLLTFESSAASAAFSPEGDQVVVAHRTGDGDIEIQWLDTETGESKRSMAVDGTLPHCFSPDGRTLVVIDAQNFSLKLWDLQTGTLRTTLPNTSIPAAFSGDCQALAAASRSAAGAVYLFDPISGEPKQSLHGLPDDYGSSAVALSGDGALVAVAPMEGPVQLLSAADAPAMAGAEVPGMRLLSPECPEVRWLLFSPDGRLLMTEQGIWALQSGVNKSAYLRADGAAFCALSPDGTTLVVNGGVLDVQSGLPTDRLKFPVAALATGYLDLTSACFLPDGRTMAVAQNGESQGRLVLWDLQTGREGATVADGLTGGFRVSPLIISPDGDTLAFGKWPSDEGTPTVELRAAQTGRIRCSLPLGDGKGGYLGLASLAFSPDGKTVAGGGQWSGDASHGEVRLWDAETGALRRTLKHSEDVSVLCLSFSPEGNLLATGGVDESVKLWDVGSGKLLRTLKHEAGVQAVAFSPDGGTLATADVTVKLWNVTQLRLN